MTAESYVYVLEYPQRKGSVFGCSLFSAFLLHQREPYYA